jgi:hypothetical protein
LVVGSPMIEGLCMAVGLHVPRWEGGFDGVILAQANRYVNSHS